VVVSATYKERLIMFDWFDKTFRRREYPTWKDVPDLNKVYDDMEKEEAKEEKINE
jgi:hypothetical protein